MKNTFVENYQLAGEKLKIFTFPAPVLKKIAKPVEVFDESLELLCKNMLFTMYHAPGIGLAAPQVGESIRLFVIDLAYSREEVTTASGDKEYRLSNFSPRIYINPKIEKIGGEIAYEEGCLSVPGIYEDVNRAEFIKITYQDLKGEFHVEEHKELDAVCIQHENDHLDGIVFLERLSTLKRNFLTKKYLKSVDK